MISHTLNAQLCLPTALCLEVWRDGKNGLKKEKEKDLFMYIDDLSAGIFTHQKGAWDPLGL